MIMGDFNVILGMHERVGLAAPDVVACWDLRDFIQNANLTVVSTGPSCNWVSNANGGNLMASKLDRTLVSDSFIGLWASISGEVLARHNSDHHLILLKCFLNNGGSVA